jgi:Icc protein
MKFIQISDTHLVGPGRDLFGINPAQRLTQCLEDILREQADAEFVVITGDLSEDGTVASYRTLRSLLARFPIPVYLTLGNHDDRSNFRTVFPDASFDSNGFAQVAIAGSLARVLLLDTSHGTRGVEYGTLCHERLAWLDAQLAEDPGTTVVIGLHHPPFAVGIEAIDRIALADSGALHDVIGRHSHVRHLFFGHVHRPLAGSWRGIPISVCYGTSYQSSLGLLSGSPKQRMRGPAEYAVFLINETDVVVHFQDFLYGYAAAESRMEGAHALDG